MLATDVEGTLLLRPLQLVFRSHEKSIIIITFIMTVSVKWNREYKQIIREYRIFEELPQYALERVGLQDKQ